VGLRHSAPAAAEAERRAPGALLEAKLASVMQARARRPRPSCGAPRHCCRLCRTRGAAPGLRPSDTHSGTAHGNAPGARPGAQGQGLQHPPYPTLTVAPRVGGAAGARAGPQGQGLQLPPPAAAL